jgi:hypothetical protein
MSKANASGKGRIQQTNEVVSLFERRTSLQDRDQILLLNFIQRLGITRKKPDSSIRRIFLVAFDVDWG